jgi:hypothetical protein
LEFVGAFRPQTQRGRACQRTHRRPKACATASRHRRSRRKAAPSDLLYRRRSVAVTTTQRIKPSVSTST